MLNIYHSIGVKMKRNADTSDFCTLYATPSLIRSALHFLLSPLSSSSLLEEGQREKCVPYDRSVWVVLSQRKPRMRCKATVVHKVKATKSFVLTLHNTQLLEFPLNIYLGDTDLKIRPTSNVFILSDEFGFNTPARYT